MNLYESSNSTNYWTEQRSFEEKVWIREKIIRIFSISSSVEICQLKTIRDNDSEERIPGAEEKVYEELMLIIKVYWEWNQIVSKLSRWDGKETMESIEIARQEKSRLLKDSNPNKSLTLKTSRHIYSLSM